MRNLLTETEIEEALQQLPGWSFEKDTIRKSFVFSNFREAVSFIVRLAFEAEQANHHPELYNVYNKVEVALNTHDAGNKVTAADISLAGAIESFSWA